MTPPVYSIVVPLYNTAQYLPALLASLENQVGHGEAFELELLFIDDSSPDAAGAIAQAWLDRTGLRGAVVHQVNAGVSAARNRGLDLATGAWIAFIDSDDFISSRYVLGVHQLLGSLGRGAGDLSLVSCNVARYFEADESYDHAHPLRDKFNRGDRVFALEEHPEFIQSQAASAFFPLDRLRASGIRFIEGLHAAEDAIFVASYLVTQRRPEIACVASSDYYYRQRRTRDSAVDQFTTNPDFYFARFSRGYLPMLRWAQDELGGIPRWLGQYFLYDMRWFFPREMDASRKATHLDTDQKARVLELVEATLQFIQPSWVREYSITGMSLELRDLLLALMGAPLLSEGGVEVHGIDLARGLVELRYRFAGDQPLEAVTVGGHPATVRGEKTRSLDYLGQTILKQRILWVEADDGLAVVLNGRQQRVHAVQDGQTAFSMTRARLGFDRFENPMGPPSAEKATRPLLRRFVGRARREAAALAPSAFSDRHLRALGEQLKLPRKIATSRVHAQRPGVRARLRRGWLFVDRSMTAGGNAEALYRHVRDEAPGVNAMFVIRRDSPEWGRLKASGVRLIALGSLEHWAALQHARFVISSELGVEEAAPMPDEGYWGGQPPWRFVFLQSTFTMKDRALWLEGQPISLVAARDAVQASQLTADQTPGPLTSLQVAGTGFARHDELVRIGRKHPWWERQTLLLDLQRESSSRTDLIREAALNEIASRHGVDIVILPRDSEGQAPAESNARLASADDSRKALLASALVCLTDSSTTAFDAAAAGAAVLVMGAVEPEAIGARVTEPRKVNEAVAQLFEVAGRQMPNPQASQWSVAGLDGEASGRILAAINDLE